LVYDSASYERKKHEDNTGSIGFIVNFKKMTKKHFYFFVSGVCIAGYIWTVLNFFNHSIRGLGCLFHKTTSIPCPSCGTTRSIIALLRGKLCESLYINPLGIIVFSIALALPIWMLIDLITGKASLFEFYNRINRKFSFNIFTISIIVLLIANWVWNIFKL
jgi:hypothetical protein